MAANIPLSVPIPETETYCPPAPPPYLPEFTITNVRVFDGNDILPSRYDISASRGVIASMIPTPTPAPLSPDCQNTYPNTGAIPTIDGTNRTLLPGLIDSHVHITHESQLDMLISSGITTVFDMACFPPPFLSSIRKASLLPTSEDSTSLPVRPAFFSAGTPAMTSDSRHAKMIPFTPSPGTFVDVIPGSSGEEQQAQVKEWVDNRITEGSEYIKIIADNPGPTREMVQCLVQEARERGMVSVAHAANLETWEGVVDGGADLVTHVPMDGVLSDVVVEKFVQRGASGKGKVKGRAAVPTLTMSKGIANFRSSQMESQGQDAKGFVDMAMRNSFESVRKLRDAEKQGKGVVVLAGTDANTLAFANVKHGESLVEELEFLVKGVGYTPVEALRAATSVPAGWWGLESRGVIEIGAKADLLLVEGEPWKELGDLRNVVGVWREGRAAVLKG